MIENPLREIKAEDVIMSDDSTVETTVTSLKNSKVNRTNLYNDYINNGASKTVTLSSEVVIYIFKLGGSPANAVYGISSAQSSPTLLGGSNISGISFSKSGTTLTVTNNSGAGCGAIVLAF